MEKEDILQSILAEGLVAIIRLKAADKISPVARAIARGGLHHIEVSLNTPDAIEGIRQLAAEGSIVAGAGTVTTAAEAEAVIRAGAQFVVTPISKKEIIDTCHDMGKPIFSGAFSPAEIYQAHHWGADIIKVFPAGTLGMHYLKAVKAPFPDLKLMPTGGVTAENIDQWFEMGADCVGVGGSFTHDDIVNFEEWTRLEQIARKFKANLSHFLHKDAS